ncbi:ATP-grasp domain-containing protein [Rhodococcus sp. IEGM 1351]|uniref:ATP-grasp domain-containing protein n=1 Tax=Rhodococcus sp. IEGM 1351 TaxID=3047089 RepID=UPI0024B739A7|nr:ATP-grasp domain-containing protein [Rhodococcus sp. IEGM 1351]MDI9939257.1 ATP-grasp domain-containing protein [Rhodococcus sp. IEGM 1351]
MAHLLLVESWVGAMGTLLPRALADLGVEFTFLTRRPEHYPESLPDGSPHPLRRGRAVVTAETNDPAGALDAARRIHAEAPLDGVLTSCDYYLSTAARIACELGLPGPAPEAVEIACGKARTRAMLDRAGIAGPRHAIAPIDDRAALRAAAETVGFPLVVKPTDLCAGMFVRRADDWATLETAAGDLRRFEVNARGQRRDPVVLLEEFLDGPEFSVESWIRHGEIHTVGVTDKSLGGASGFVETGHMFPADLTDEYRAQLVTAAEAAINAIGLDHGVVHTELRLTAAGPRIIEINPRPAGNQITELIRHVTGIDLPTVAIELALGRTPQPPTLPQARQRPRSAAVSMLVPTEEGVLTGIDGATAVADHPAVVSSSFKAPGHKATVGVDNNSYLGSVITVSHERTGARPLAEQLLSSISVTYAEVLAR